MVFVLLTYGGWNGEPPISRLRLKEGRRNMLRALVWSMFILTVLYLLVNLAYLRGLGSGRMARSRSSRGGLAAAGLGQRRRAFDQRNHRGIGADLDQRHPSWSVRRSNYALGRDWPALSFLGHWDARTGRRTQALLLQAAVALALIAFGAVMRQGFETMVDTRRRLSGCFFPAHRPRAVFVRCAGASPQRRAAVPWPLYPLLPAAFLRQRSRLLYASLASTRLGAGGCGRARCRRAAASAGGRAGASR